MLAVEFPPTELVMIMSVTTAFAGRITAGAPEAEETTTLAAAATLAI
jgi:hypothetical protein